MLEISSSWFWWLVLSIVCFTAGEVFSKIWANNNSKWLLPLIFISYLVGVAAWLPAINQYNKIAVVGTIWCIMSLIATPTVGILFGEKLNYIQYLGIALAVLAIIMMEQGDKK